MKKDYNYKALLIFLCIVPFVSYSQVSTTTERGYLIEFNEMRLDQFISYSHSDTIVNGKRIRYEVKKDALQLNTAKCYFEYESDMLLVEKVEVYCKDKIVYSALNYKGVPIEKYSYKYDSSGRVINRSGFSSGDSGSTIYYSY